MTRETLRELARNRWPVVQMETGAHGEIVYPYIREIKVVYASPDELRAGFPGNGRRWSLRIGPGGRSRRPARGCSGFRPTTRPGLTLRAAWI